MFLQIQKIGKNKHKFKAKIHFIKLVNQQTEKGIHFKVKIERGEHQIQAISQPSRKGIAKFPNSQYVIPMSLFCDQSQKKLTYLQKQAKIKAYQSDESGKQIRKIATKTIDLSQYAQKGILKMQIQLEPQKSMDSPILTMQIYLERQSDDSKSVDTYSSNNDKINQDNEQTKNIKSKIKNKEQKFQKQSQKDIVKNSNKNIQTSSSPGKSQLSKDKQIKKQQLSQKEIQMYKKSKSRKNESGITPFTTKSYNQSQNNKFNIKEDQQNQGSDGQSSSMQNKTTNKKKKVQIIPQKVKQIERQTIKKAQEQKNSRKTVQTQFNQGQSPELQSFLLKKALKQKQLQLNTLKRQHEILKKTMQKLIQQTSSKKQVQRNTGYEKQIQQLKKAMVTKDITIDKLISQNKIKASRQQQYQKIIMKLRHQQLMDRQKISDLKYRQAFLMQQLFQTANKQALEQACRFLAL